MKNTLTGERYLIFMETPQDRVGRLGKLKIVREQTLLS